MARKRRRFTAEFKARVALEALQERDSVQAIAARHELHPNQVSAWKRQLVDAVPEVFAKGGSRKLAKEHEAKIHDLHAKIGRADGGAGFFSARVEALSRAERFGMIEPDGPLSLSRHRAFERHSGGGMQILMGVDAPDDLLAHRWPPRHGGLLRLWWVNALAPDSADVGHDSEGAALGQALYQVARDGLVDAARALSWPAVQHAWPTSSASGP